MPSQINTESDYGLQWPDYLVVSFCLLFSASIGIFFAFKDRANKNLENYLLGNRQMRSFPVALSLTASFISAIAILGLPNEYYSYGTMFTYYCITHIAISILVALFFVPKFYNESSISIYIYLENRYRSKVPRYTATIIYVIITILYNGVVVYAPALALEQVAGIPIFTGTVVVLGVCIFYTFLGGLNLGGFTTLI